MTRIRLAAGAALLAFAGVAASATTAAAEFFGWQVANVANWDVLNVRAWPASYSQILVAYPNGTPLSLTGKCTNELNLNQIAGWPAGEQAEAAVIPANPRTGIYPASTETM